MYGGDKAYDWTRAYSCEPLRRPGISGPRSQVENVSQNPEYFAMVFLILPFFFYESVDGQSKCVNIYDVRLEDDAPFCGMQWPPDLKNISSYLAVGPLLTGPLVTV